MHKNILGNDDWKTLVEMHAILKPFRDETMLLQSRAEMGDRGAAWEVLPAVTEFFNKIKEKAAKYHANLMSEYANIEHNHILYALTACIKKLEKYQALLSKSPIYFAATAMNPFMKWEWCFTKQADKL